MKNHYVENITSHLMTSGAKTVDLTSNLIEKRYWGMKRAIQCFFEFFLAIILLELIAIVCEEIISSKFDLW